MRSREKSFKKDLREKSRKLKEERKDLTALLIAKQKHISDEVDVAIEQKVRNQTKTGRDWCEENDTIGYIGLSRGTDARYPILVYNNRSYGGGAILDHCILKIKETKGGRVIYQAQNYNAPEVQIQHSDLAGYAYNTIVNGNLYGRHKTLKSAELLKNKLL